MFSLMIACALAPGAPMPLPGKALHPTYKPGKRVGFWAEAGQYTIVWMAPDPQRRNGYLEKGGWTIKLLADGQYRAEPGGWWGYFSWDAKTYTFSVKETRDGWRWTRWKACFIHPRRGWREDIGLLTGDMGGWGMRFRPVWPPGPWPPNKRADAPVSRR
jgi:hypothetical protein